LIKNLKFKIKNSFYQANSYEHDEAGYTTEGAKARKRQVERRLAKIDQYLQEDIEPPQFYGDPRAKLTLVGWGSSKGPVLQAINDLSADKAGSRLAISYLHFTHLWPFPKNWRLPEKSVLIEDNATGQLGQLICQETRREIKDKLLKYNGRPFYPEEIETYVRRTI
jgi:2-oxoglutarate ferredoxin oxidoreductase subunit alpha